MVDVEKLSEKSLCSGLLEENGTFTCVYCGKVFEAGEVFPDAGRFFDARRAAEMHAASHNDKLEQLMDSGGKALSLTENQKTLLRLFASGLRDAEIAKQLGVTPSTIWTLAEEGKQNQAAQETLLAPHEGAKMVDERYVITEEENQKILENVFYSLEPLKLKVFSKKEKKKIVILRQVAAQFESGRTYTEREVNAILKEIWDDFATMRRYLIEYGYLDRTTDGSSYCKRG